MLTQHNQESAQWSLDLFPHERVGSEDETNITEEDRPKLLLVSSPDQIFCTCPADLSKNRVWTLSLRKLAVSKLGNCRC